MHVPGVELQVTWEGEAVKGVFEKLVVVLSGKVQCKSFSVSHGGLSV